MLKNKETLIKSATITLGVVVAILIAKALEMEYYSSVGTIVIVSMLSSKKQSFQLAWTRLMAAIVSLALSSVLFLALGFSFWVLALYIFIFTFLMYRFNTKIAIVLNVVLVMHIYSAGEVTPYLILNEFLLMFLGIVVALIFNFYSPDLESELIAYQKKVEEKFNLIFKNMGLCLMNECKIEEINEQLDQLYHLLTLAKDRAYKHMNSFYVYTNNYYVEYFTMRKQQYYIVSDMRKYIKPNFLNKSEVRTLKLFTDGLIVDVDVIDACEKQLHRLEGIKHQFHHAADLPTTRSQLKNRIALHQYLYSLEEFIQLKVRFLEKVQWDKTLEDGAEG